MPPLDDDERRIAENIRLLRIQAGLSQNALAEAVGISHQQICRYETAASRIPVGRLRVMASALSVSIEAFFDGLPDRRGEKDCPASYRRLSRMAIRLAHMIDNLPESEARALALLITSVSEAARRKRQTRSRPLLSSRGPHPNRNGL